MAIDYFLNCANNILCKSAQNKLPKSKKYLLSCSRVWLEGLNVSRLPPELFNLKNLEFLGLDLPLIELHQDIAKLANLKILNIKSPELKELPSSFIQLKKLRHFSLRSKNFEKLPENIENMSSLESITVWDSKLKNFQIVLQL